MPERDPSSGQSGGPVVRTIIGRVTVAAAAYAEVPITESISVEKVAAGVVAQAIVQRLADRHTQGASGVVLLHLAGLLLPAPSRQRWMEEWRGELYDLRAEGARWWSRAASR